MTDGATLTDMDIADPEARRRVAEAIKRRRRELRLRQEDVSAAGGPSKAVLFQIENCVPKGFADATIESLEEALHWAYGSLAAIAAGGQPTDADQQDTPGGEAPSEDGAMTLSWSGWTLELHPNPTASPEAAERVMQQIMAAAVTAWNESGIDAAAEAGTDDA